MSLEEKVSITISITKNYRDRLRTMAARQNLHDPDQLTSASTIAREIICKYIDEIDSIEADFREAALDVNQQENAEQGLSVKSQMAKLD